MAKKTKYVVLPRTWVCSVLWLRHQLCAVLSADFSADLSVDLSVDCQLIFLLICQFCLLMCPSSFPRTWLCLSLCLVGRLFALIAAISAASRRPPALLLSSSPVLLLPKTQLRILTKGRKNVIIGTRLSLNQHYSLWTLNKKS